MKCSHKRKHQVNKNCERLLKEYKILLNSGQLTSAEIIKKRIVRRYGKNVLPNPSEN